MESCSLHQCWLCTMVSTMFLALFIVGFTMEYDNSSKTGVGNTGVEHHNSNLVLQPLIMADAEVRSVPTTRSTTSHPPRRGGRIPRIVHQTWKSHTLYPAQRQWRENCVKLNPEWEFRIWNDTENHDLIEQHFSWFLEVYDSYPKTINKVDAIRIFYLARFGGIYMDLDYTCLKPFDALIDGAEFIVAEDEANQNLTSRHIHMTGLLGVGNSFMAGIAGHEIWVNATSRLKFVRDKVRDETGELAGVWFIRCLVQGFRSRFKELGVRVLPMQSVSPMTWGKADHFGASKICTKFEDLDQCRQKFPNSTTVSFWTGTWQTSGRPGAEVSRLSWDHKRQAMLGLRGFGDLKKDMTIGDLEEQAAKVVV
eukprot:m.91242 g.91242  ORF g.91242 m.91242 type:complete len:366 (+) comp26452_c3_seq2:517-1614(+)